MSVRPCGWDHKTLPYKPPSPCFLFYEIPGNPVWRVSTCNARGEFCDLQPGLPYKEACHFNPLPLMECAPPRFPPELRRESTPQERKKSGSEKKSGSS
ncbi:hypothetical protein ADEAN_000586900 [Angomonas deanei]|uniref:Uncharacterized protein n=1 Tax=Angomonas deanei TaxID=59799 RepID=A0A7G2CHD6_9TRYP|nr:hypothetical protein ADEAN_000586900 [Angomonas deanei]